MEYLTSREVAKQLHIHDVTICKWRVAGKGPIYYKVGRMVRYKQDDVMQWIEAMPKYGNQE